MAVKLVENFRSDIKARFYRAWALTCIALLLITLSASFLWYYLSVIKRVENFSIEEKAHISTLKQRVKADLTQFLSDVMVLSAISHPVPMSRQLMLIDMMEQLCNHKDIYSRFGFYNLSGYETLSVECEKDRAFVKDKGESDPTSLLAEYQYISKLDAGEFHLSEINIQPGREEDSTLAVAAPLLSDKSEKNGYLVAYFNAALLAKDLWVNNGDGLPHEDLHDEGIDHSHADTSSPLLHSHSDSVPHSGHMFILNRHGVPLGSSIDVFPEGLSSFKLYFPEVWSLMKTRSSGSIKSKHGLFNYQSFEPLAAVKQHEAMLHGQSFRFARNYDRNWILLSYLSPDELAALSHSFWKTLFFALPIFILIALYGSYVLLKSLYMRIQVKQELIEKESHLRTIKDSMVDGILLCDSQGMIVSANPATAKIFGFRSTELEGMHIQKLIPMGSKENHEKYMLYFFQSDNPGMIMQRREVTGITKSGDNTAIEVTITKTHDSGQPLALVLIRDINEQKIVDKEMENLRLKYFHREKMAEMGMLVGGVLHEVGNPIASIQGLLNAMIMEDDSNETPLLDESFRQYIDMVVEQTARIQTISQQISGFISPRSGEFELLDLNTLISSTSALLSYDNRWREIQMETSLDTQLPAVEAIGDQLIQVMMNLLVNAADALNDKFTHSYEDEKPFIRISTGRLDDETIFLSVKDNGCGIDKEKVGRIFDAFYTTKAEGKGTGLGLALCESIIENHNGEIEIESDVGQGTEIRVYLPVIHKESTSE